MGAVAKKPSKSSTKGSGRARTLARAKPAARPKSKAKAPPPPRQQKTKPLPAPAAKKRRVYTEKELNIPKLNMVTPIGVQPPKGKKKGKIFIDDKESMMTILALVNADREGQLESKIMKARQLEEIREAKRKELEARQEAKKSKLDEAKESVRHKRKRKRGDASAQNDAAEPTSESSAAKKSRKRVSFA